MESKRDKIKALVVEMLNNSHEAMIKNIDKALNSGAIDIDSWQVLKVTPWNCLD